MLREVPPPLQFIARHIPIALFRWLYLPNVHTAEESGDASARLVTEPELATTTGQYFEGRRQIRSSDESYNDERATELWNASVTLTATNQDAKHKGLKP
jgi:hypothetical protein